MKNITPSYPFGVLNQISKPTIQDRVDPRTTTFFEAAKKAAEDQYESDTLAQRGAFTGVILRVEYLETESSLLPWQRLIMPFSPELVQVFWRVKARIPELHVAIPEPSMYSMGQDDTGPHNHIIDMHPTFIATGPLPYEPAPGDIALFDFEDRQNQEGPQLISIINGQNAGTTGGSAGAGGAGGSASPYGSSAHFRNARGCGGISTSAPRGDVIARGPSAPVLPVQPTPAPRTGSVSEYLQQNGISQRLADNIDDYHREAPREKWPNMVVTAQLIMEMERRTGFHLEVFSTYRPNQGPHDTYGACDIKARYETGTDERGEEVSDEEWIFCMRSFMNFWRNEGEALDMGLGFYQDNWYPERQIHVDTLIDSHRRWTWGPDNGKHPRTGEDTGGKPFHKWFEGFGSNARRTAREKNEGRLSEICKDAFWALIEQGFPSEDDFRRVFSGYGHTGEVGDDVVIRPIPDVNNIYEGVPRRDINVTPPTTAAAAEGTGTEEGASGTLFDITAGAGMDAIQGAVGFLRGQGILPPEEEEPRSLFDITAGAAMDAIQSTVNFMQERGIFPPDPADQIPAAAPTPVTNCVRTVGSDGTVQWIEQSSDVSSMSTGRYAAYSGRSREDVKCMVIHCTAGSQRSDPDDVVESWIGHAHRIGGLPRSPRVFRDDGTEKLTAGPVATHFVIMKDGTIVGLWDDPFAHGAWHGGPFNKASIGVDFEGDPGSQSSELTPEQYEALGELVMTREFAHLPMLGHRHFSTKTCPADPGPVPHFPWHQEPFRSRCLPHVSETALRISQGEDVDEDDDRDPGPRRNERGSRVNDAWRQLMTIGSALEAVYSAAASALTSYRDLARYVDRSEVYMARAHTRRQAG